MSKLKLAIPSSIFSALLIFVDQISKYLVRRSDGFYLCNPGIAWNIKMPPFVFWAIWIGIIAGLLYLIVRNILTEKLDRLFLFSLFIILAGALGNLIDRMLFGCILDFIDLRIWPVFNLADSFITIGVMIILVKLFKKNQLF